MYRDDLRKYLFFIWNLHLTYDGILLKEKTRKRLHFHGTDREALISFLGVKNLPIEFGGELEMPNQPIGQDIYEYIHKFEKKFEGNSHPFPFYFILPFIFLNINEI